MDPALAFWLRHVECAGGLSEPAGDATLVMLPPALTRSYHLPEELYVTGDPDVAREDHITFLGSGHPVVTQAAAALLDAGDVGHLVLERPRVQPSADELLEDARGAFPVDHGRIDLAGEPSIVTHLVLRVGALLTYELSTEDRLQEQAERWVDLPARCELPAAVTSRLAHAATGGGGMAEAEGLLPGLAEAHRLIEEAAVARRDMLAARLDSAHAAERSRAIGYYTDAIAGIEKRLETAAPDRRATLLARLDGTRQEQSRRLAEIAEKYQARHEIKPYRLHVLAVPALRVPVDVRRGERRYPMRIDWLLPAGAYAPIRCPTCGEVAPLVAGKKSLGCTSCQPKAAPPSPPAPRPRPAPSAPTKASTTKPSAPAKAASTTKPSAPTKAAAPAKASAPPRHGPARPSAPAPRRRWTADRAARLAEDLIRAIATSHGRKAGALLAAETPAQAMHRLYGTAGLARVLGLHAGELPSRFAVHTVSDTVIQGDLIGDRGTECTYYLYLRGEQVTEALPFVVFQDGKFWNMYWWGRMPSALQSANGLTPVSALDPVEQSMTRKGPGWNGLPVVARALAAWHRLGDHHERLRTAHTPQALAAAVHRLVTYRAGDRAAFADGAAVYQIDERDMRRADAAMRGLLALGPGHVW
jgi:hypothetical protein